MKAIRRVTEGPYDAVEMFLLRAAEYPEDALFIRRLDEFQRAEAAQYLRGLAKHVAERRSVPYVKATP